MADTPKKVVVDLSKPKGQRESIIELTQDEIQEREAQAVEAEAQRQAEEAAAAERETNRQAGIATLKGLGLTDAQIEALLGN
jgi:regulator of protease activity HflC (stomatin/prohibitin superfamily)